MDQTVVLLVEDDAADVALFQRHLPIALGPTRVVLHGTLAEALASLHEESFDLALVDLGLPDALDDDAVIAIRGAAPALPMVVLTDDEQQGTAERILRCGAEDYLPKAELDALSLRRAARHARERARMRTDALAHATQQDRLGRQASNNERLTAIGRIAAGVAHEINNPAAFIAANLETSRAMLTGLEHALGRSHENITTLRECIEESAGGITRICTIVKDLKAFSQVKDDEAEWVDLDEVVDAACNLLECHIEPGIRLTRHSDHPPAVAAVRDKLVQVVTNLLLNALQAVADTPGGAREVGVEIAQVQAGIHLSVVDSGPGIPEALRPRVFEPFFTTKGTQGTGLGLALCAEIAAAHGGSLVLESNVGAGTRVTLELPHETGLTPQVQSIRRQARPETRPRVLLVDDDDLVRSAMERLLKKTCEMHVAAGGREALALLETPGLVIDVVLCDLSMPELDGPGLHAQICQRMPHLRDRFVFLTGGAFSDRTRAFIESCDACVVNKPAQRQELVDAISRIGRIQDASAEADPQRPHHVRT